jgi:imidazolonepropionase-like amidohydrolase
MRIFIILTLNFLLAIPPVLANKQITAEANHNTVLISQVNIIDVANNGIKANQFVLIKGEKIQQISSEKPKVSVYTKLIDGKGKYLMAGLIDMHVHVFQPADLYQLITHGVTTARVMYGWPHTLKYRDDIKQGTLVGPELVVSSPAINQESPYASSNLHSFVDSPQEGSKLVKKYAKQGYDLIKTYDGLRPEVFSALAKAAHENELPIAGHPSFYLSIDDYIAAQPQTIEHIEMLYQAALDYSTDNASLVKLVKKLAVYQIPVTTILVAYDNVARLAVEKHEFINDLSVSYIHPMWRKLEQGSIDFITNVDKPQKWRNKADYLGYMAKVLNDNGVPLVLGSDGGSGHNINGKSTIDEMELLVHYGVPPNDVLRAATITPAKVLDLELEIGIVAPGYIANLILLNSDPRNDFSVLRKPEVVIKSGRLFEQAALAELDRQAQQHMSLMDTALYLLRAF